MQLSVKIAKSITRQGDDESKSQLPSAFCHCKVPQDLMIKSGENVKPFEVFSPLSYSGKEVIWQ